jgi:hypothetical protein
MTHTTPSPSPKNGTESRTPMIVAIIVLIVAVAALVVIFALPPRMPAATATPETPIVTPLATSN